jgi:hypothetical protein
VRGELPEPARNISGTFSKHETNITSVAAAKKKHNFERGRTYFKLRPGYPQYPVADATSLQRRSQ